MDPNESGNIRSLNGSYYGLYRVQVDLMGHELLCGKELVYLLDGLWAGSEAIDPPTKWESAPFNSDWTSSVFASQDPVAIESVAFDFLRTEYTAANHPGLDYPQMNGVDDYLHQAADAANWPVGITYDPENDGTPLGSLGVHEHWNNAVNKQYSRNLGMNKGIELIQIPGTVVSEPVIHLKPDLSFTAYPNPFRDMLALSFQLDKPAEINLAVYNIEGKMVKSLKNELLQAGNHQVHWSSASGDLPPGTYFLRLSGKQGSKSFYESKKIQKIK